MGEFTHFNEQGHAVMVDVSEKSDTVREATAMGRISMSQECFEKVKTGGTKKGDVLGTARIAGIMGAKRTSELIPLCHILNLSKVMIEFEYIEAACEIEARCTAKTVGKTGCRDGSAHRCTGSTATIYDMCKAVDKGMCMKDIRLLEKTGGKKWSVEAGQEKNV